MPADPEMSHRRSRLTAALATFTALMAITSLMVLPSGATTQVIDERCSPTDKLELWASPLITGALATSLDSDPLHLRFPVTATASPFVDPAGGVIDYDVTIDLDLQTITDRMLTDRMAPLIRGLLTDWGFTQPMFDEAAASSYVNLRFQQLRWVVPLPAGTTLEGTPSVVGTGGLQFTATPGSGGVEVALVFPSGGVAAGSYGTPANGASTTTTLPTLGTETATAHFSVRTPPGLPDGSSVDLGPVSLTLYLDVEPGLANFNQLSGLAEAPFACSPADATAVLASTEVRAAPVAPTTSPPGTSGTQGVPSPTTVPSSATTTAAHAAATTLTPRFTG